jgi:DTW domain-containing protein YfiP
VTSQTPISIENLLSICGLFWAFSIATSQKNILIRQNENVRCLACLLNDKCCSLGCGAIVSAGLATFFDVYILILPDL